MSFRFFARATAALLAVFLLVVGCLLAAYLSLTAWASTPAGARLFVWAAERASGLDLEVGSIGPDSRHRGVLKGDGPALLVEDLRVVAAGGEQLLSASTLALCLAPKALLGGRIAAVGIEGFTLRPETAAAQSPGAGSSLRLPFDELSAVDGRLPLALETGARQLAIERLNLRRDGAGRFGVDGHLRLGAAAFELGGALAEAGAAAELTLEAGPGALAALAAALGQDRAPAEVIEYLKSTSGTARIYGSLLETPHVVIQLRSEYEESAEEGLRGEATIEFELGQPQLPGAFALRDVELRRSSAALSVASVGGRFRIGALGENGQGLKDPQEPQTRWVEISRLELSGLSGHDADYRRGAEGLSIRGELAAEIGDLPARGIRGEISLSSGELLWERFYGSFRDHPARVGFEAELTRVQAATGKAPVASGFELKRGGLRVAGLGEASLAGRYEPVARRVALELRAQLPQAAGAYRMFVQEPFADRYPFLAELEAEGALAVDLSLVAGEEGLEALSGWIKGRDVDLRSADGRWRLEGGRWSLPVAISARDRPRKADSGSLQFDRAVVAGIEVAGAKFPLVVRSNAFDGAGDVGLDLLGGSVRVSALRARKLQDSRRELRFAAEVSSLDLTALARSQGLPELEGRLEGRLSEVRLSSSSLTTEGSLRAGLLGGRATLAELGVSGLSSSVPTLHLDATLEGLDLARATRLLGVGRISGIAQGEVHDLQIAAGEPVRFDARFETVPRRGVPQRISVRAIEQLSVLGGSGSSPVTRGILSFFDEYRYAKMGLRCSLRNDRFILRGVERLKEKDFLVVGTFMPPTVNVISHNQVIAFKDMVGRMERIVAVGEADAK